MRKECNAFKPVDNEPYGKFSDEEIRQANEKYNKSKPPSKKQKRITLIVLAVLLLVVAVFVILSPDPDDLWTGVIDESLVGAWRGVASLFDEPTWVFFSDGTGVSPRFDRTFEWSVNGDILVRRYPDRLSTAYRYSFVLGRLRLSRMGDGTLPGYYNRLEDWEWR